VEVFRTDPRPADDQPPKLSATPSDLPPFHHNLLYNLPGRGLVGVRIRIDPASGPMPPGDWAVIPFGSLKVLVKLEA
jgi:hypothetical protein